MGFTITEIQITCIVLMGLITMVLIFFLPKKEKAGIVFDKARKLLACGTFLLTVHFLIQYNIHKPQNPIPDVRTIINLLFGIPLTFFFDISLLYLQRRGVIHKWEWMFAPLLLLLSIIILSLSFIFGKDLASIHRANIVISFFYAIILIVYRYLQIKEFFIIRKTIARTEDMSLIELNKWSKWVIITMALTTIGFPIMTFNTDLFMRSVYGLISLVVAFFAIFSFIGYGFYSATQFVISEKKQRKMDTISETLDTPADSEDIITYAKLDNDTLQKVAEKAMIVVESKYFKTPGITMADVASRMGVTRNELGSWLQSTEHRQFNKWLTSLRIDEAKRLIKERPTWSNSTISKECGFRNRSYFQLQFRNVVGLTPSKWRETNL